jgi:membrane protease YdiL (CAAX protease family)
MTSASIIASVQIGLLVAGVVAWFVALRNGRVRSWFAAPDRLSPWPIPGSDFFLFTLLLLVFISLGPAMVVRLFDLPPVPGDGVRETLLHGFAFQLAGLAACLLFRVHPHGVPPGARVSPSGSLATSAVAFLYVVPVFSIVVAATYGLLYAAGLDPREQDLIGTFRNASSPIELGGLVLLAVVIAPVTEELIFRAGFFRFLHARVSPAWAMGVSSILFALLHQNTLTFPSLVLLGVVLCLVYRKTGSLIAPIGLHALFNLNSVLVILLGPEN